MTELEVIDADDAVEVVEVGGSLTAAPVVAGTVQGTVEVVAGLGHVDATTTVAPPYDIESSHAPRTVTLGQQGPRGPAGEPGPAGPPGPGSGAVFYHVHSQLAPSPQWWIDHNLGMRPSVTVTDSAGAVVIGDVVYVSDHSLTVSFSHPFGGHAYLS